MPDQSSPEEPTSIYLLSIKTGEKRRLTLPPAGSMGDSGPILSPNGKELAFIRTSGTHVEDIYHLPLDSRSEPKRLTYDGASLSSLAWTSDNREIVFSSAREGIFILWRLPVSGGTPERLTAVGLDAVQPSISRQGNRLAYTQVVSDANIWRAEVSRTRVQVSPPTVLISSTRFDAGPQYSPDGSRIAFQSDRSGNHEIWVCDSDGLNPTQVTNMGGPFTGVPRWSPDGRQVVFDSRVAGTADIFVCNVEDGRPRRLTTEASWQTGPLRAGSLPAHSPNCRRCCSKT